MKCGTSSPSRRMITPTGRKVWVQVCWSIDLRYVVWVDRIPTYHAPKGWSEPRTWRHLERLGWKYVSKEGG